MRAVHGPLSIRIDGARLLLILLDIFSPILMNCSCKKEDFPIKIICGWCITSGCLLIKSLLMFEKTFVFLTDTLHKDVNAFENTNIFVGVYVASGVAGLKYPLQTGQVKRLLASPSLRNICG